MDVEAIIIRCSRVQMTRATGIIADDKRICETLMRVRKTNLLELNVAQPKYGGEYGEYAVSHLLRHVQYGHCETQVIERRYIVNAVQLEAATLLEVLVTFRPLD